MFDIDDGSRKAKEIKFSEYFVCGQPAAHHSVCRAKHQRNECRLFSDVGACSLFFLFFSPTSSSENIGDNIILILYF